MPGEHTRRGQRQRDRAAALVFTGPLAVIGVTALWAASYLTGGSGSAQPPPEIAAVYDANAPALSLTPGSTTVRVRLSAALQTMVSDHDFIVTLPRDATVETLLNRLSDSYPVIAALGPSVMVAASGEMQRPDRVLVDGELVDLATQMAGG